MTKAGNADLSDVLQRHLRTNITVQHPFGNRNMKWTPILCTAFEREVHMNQDVRVVEFSKYRHFVVIERMKNVRYSAGTQLVGSVRMR